MFSEGYFFYRKENPRLGLGFKKAYSVVLKKLSRGAKIFLVRQPKYQHTEEF
jgi:putative transposase